MDSAEIQNTTLTAKVPYSTFLGIIWGGTAISFLFVIARGYTRIKSFHRFYADDVLVLLAWLMLLTTAIIWQFVGSHLYLLLAVNSRQKLPPPDFGHSASVYLRSSIGILILFYSSLWSVKVSFLLFFRRLGQGVHSQKIHWWAVSAFTLATYFACIADIEYNCLAPSFNKIGFTCDSFHAVNFQRMTLKFNCAMDVLTDSLIMSLPIVMLWKVQITLRQKVALTALFSLVIITMVFAIVRVATLNSIRTQPEESWLYMWSAIENTVSIIIVCLASFRALFTQDTRTPTPDPGDTWRKNHKSWLKQTTIKKNTIKTTESVDLEIYTGGSTFVYANRTRSDDQLILEPSNIYVKHDVIQDSS